MATPSSTRYLTSSRVAMFVVVAIVFSPSLRLRFLVWKIVSGDLLLPLRQRAPTLAPRLAAGRREEKCQRWRRSTPWSRVDAGLMPFVGPVHHAEQAEDRDAG